MVMTVACNSVPSVIDVFKYSATCSGAGNKTGDQIFALKNRLPEADEDGEEKNNEEESFHVAAVASDWAPLLSAWVIRLA